MNLSIYYDTDHEQFIVVDEDGTPVGGETPELAVANYKRWDRGRVETQCEPAPIRVMSQRRCPECFTFGYDHRRDCPNVRAGMSRHVAWEPKL